MKRPCIYILTNKPYGTLYVGVTSHLLHRLYQHQNEYFDGFTKRYKLKNLIYFEMYDDMEHAIRREKSLKRWRREWKIQLIEQHNPYWQDLSFKLSM